MQQDVLQERHEVFDYIHKCMLMSTSVVPIRDSCLERYLLIYKTHSKKRNIDVRKKLTVKIIQ